MGSDEGLIFLRWRKYKNLETNFKADTMLAAGEMLILFDFEQERRPKTD